MPDSNLSRRLTAIIAADVAEYSRLVREDEEGTLRAYRAHRNDLIDPLIAQYGGRIANTAGDSLLLEFPSAVEAVRFAVTVQEGLKARNNEIPTDKQILLRIGINIGDVISEGDDLLGDGVNVAARLEALADPGGICLSRTARDQVRDQLSFNLEDMGEVEVKNIPRPVRVFRVLRGGQKLNQAKPNKSKWLLPTIAAVVALLVLLGGGAWWWSQQTDFEPADPKKFAYSLPDKISIAVLPFRNLSKNPEHAALAGTISDELTSNLAQISSFFVIARQATSAYDLETVELRQIAEDLGVRNIVLGSVHRVDDRVRVNAQLVDAISGHQLWTGRFDKRITDIFALQDDITRTIARELSGNLSWAAGKRGTDNVDAYLIWRSAQNNLLASSPQRLAHAETLAKKAISLDPKYARAYALLALARSQNGFFRYAKDPKKAVKEGLELAQQAVALDADDWYTQFIHGQALVNVRNYEGAVEAYAKAIARDPSNAPLLTFSTLPLIFIGKPDEVIARIETATRLNPFQTWQPVQFKGMAHYMKGEYDTSLELLERSAQLNPKFIGNWFWRAAAYAQLGLDDKARAMVKKILAVRPGATISGTFIHIKDPVMMERLRDGWRKSGLPE